MSNSPEWNPQYPGQVQAWCPNCEHFRKLHGLNDCAIREVSPAAASWQRTVQDEVSSRIDPEAHGCPRFVPFSSLASRARRVEEHWSA